MPLARRTGRAESSSVAEPFIAPGQRPPGAAAVAGLLRLVVLPEPAEPAAGPEYRAG